MVVCCEYHGAGHYLAYTTASEKAKTVRKINDESRKRTSFMEVRHTPNGKIAGNKLFSLTADANEYIKTVRTSGLGSTGCFLKAEDLKKSATVC